MRVCVYTVRQYKISQHQNCYQECVIIFALNFRYLFVTKLH